MEIAQNKSFTQTFLYAIDILILQISWFFQRILDNIDERFKR